MIKVRTSAAICSDCLVSIGGPALIGWKDSNKLVATEVLAFRDSSNQKFVE